MTLMTLPTSCPAMECTTQPLRRSYPSDINTIRWSLIELLLEELDPPEQSGRRRSTDLRNVINAINYRWQTRCPWRMLPHDFPAWETVYTYFHHWEKLGLLPVIRDLILKKSVYRVVTETRHPLVTIELKVKLRKTLQQLLSENAN